ncbi:MAG: proton-conducting transporter membrane subunit [Lachnospiraceae bacterium]|nr:proton-conducting transporter membrane subunit [Lachnospiraceae bacterium]
MLLLFTVLIPVIGGPVLAKAVRDPAKSRLGFAALVILTDIMLAISLASGSSVTAARLADRVTLTFAFDGLGRLFAVVIAVMYTAVCFYAFEYMEHDERPHVFFAFYFISYGMLLAVSMSANLVTLYLAFEFLTLTTVPLVLHELTKDAIAAGLKYLFYSVGGALMGLLAVFFVYSCSTGDASFVKGGFVDPEMMAARPQVFLAVIMVGLIGFGTKAGMYPMHGWLPSAHPIAPAPASALLSGIVAKAGVLAIVRLIYYSVGTEILRGTWVQTAWMCLTMLTIFMGSMMAFREKILKKRLAYSTVSQISYILFGLSILSDDGLRGGMLHLMQHAASKGCLFLVAGIFIHKLGIRTVDDLKGIGRRMPVTLWCFTIAALSLVGIPPLGGFISKWVIASASLDSGMGVLSYLGPVILLISALLTGGYLLPITVGAFFPEHGTEEERAESAEPTLLMTAPMMVLCVCTLLVGLFGPAAAGAFGL